MKQGLLVFLGFKESMLYDLPLKEVEGLSASEIL